MTLNEGQTILQQGGLLYDNNGEIWQPKHYKLTTEDQYSYFINTDVGIEFIKDPYGNTLVYSTQGMSHSAGVQLAFKRDTTGRITQITDPAGKSITYTYNSRGELSAVTDRAQQTTRFSYAQDHLLSSITDPNGVTIAQQDYDALGRLQGQIDAAGQRTAIGYQPDQHLQTVTDRLGNPTTYRYDDDGNVTELTDALGNVTRYQYDALGNETQSTDPTGAITQKSYDAQSGKLLTETDPLGFTQQYTYSGNPSQMTSATDALGNSTQYAYFNGAPISITEPLGRIINLGFDGKGNFISLNIAGQKDQYTYNTLGQRTGHTDAAGLTTQYTLDANGREVGRSWQRHLADGSVKTLKSSRTLDALGQVLTETDPQGAIIQHHYNTAGKITQDIDALGRITQYTYDAQARLIETRYPDGAKETKSYDALGNLSQESDRAGRITRYSYDKLSRLIQTQYPDGSLSKTQYDAVGRVSQTTDALGHSTRNSYDAKGQLVSQTAPDGGITRYQYDGNGNRTQVTTPDGQITAYQYDALNRLVKTVYPDQTSSSIAWNSDGRKHSETDANGTRRDYGYDVAGRLNQVTEGQGAEQTVYQYDEFGNKIKQTDAEGRSTTWDYDDLNRLTQRTLPQGQSERFDYDLQGRLLSHTQFNGQTLRYSYDLNDRLTQTARPEATTQASYGLSGELTSQQTADGQVTYQYDAQGRKISQTNPDGSKLAWTYDAGGNLTQRTSPHGTVNYRYDAQGKLTQVTDPQNQSTTYTYDTAGRITTETHANGTETRYRYDSLGRITQLLHVKPGTQNSQNTTTAEILTGSAYTLAANGRREQVTEFDSQSTLDNTGSAQNPSRTQRYQYDPAGRLSQIDDYERSQNSQSKPIPSRTETLSYDKVGNRTQRTVTNQTLDANNAVQASDTATTQYSYDSNDRLTQESTTQVTSQNPSPTPAQTTNYAWDANGRLTKKQEATQVTLYTWNSQDQLIEIKKGLTEATAQPQINYQYGAGGNRTQEIKHTSQGDQITKYLIDDTFPNAQVVEASTTSSNQTQTTHYVWGNRLIKQLRGGQSTYYHEDALGSIKALSDANATTTDSYQYDAFGNLQNHQGLSDQPYRFAGEHYDETAQWQYHRARWYDLNTGRFTALDPFSGYLSQPATLHKYAYGGNDPVNSVDPSGLISGSLSGDVGVAVNINAILSNVSTGQVAKYAFKQVGCEIISAAAEEVINGIYILYNAETGVYYVGQSKNVPGRTKYHEKVKEGMIHIASIAVPFEKKIRGVASLLSMVEQYIWEQVSEVVKTNNSNNPLNIKKYKKAYEKFSACK